MFTVKHSDAEIGTESLYTAETIEVVRGGDHFNDGIFLDREPPVSPEEDRVRCSKHIINFGGEATPSAKMRKGGRVWVMNEHGATVASYEL